MSKRSQSQANAGTLYKLAAWLAFLMLGWLGIRGYKNSVEKLKTDMCIDQVLEIMHNVMGLYADKNDYGELDYKMAFTHKLLPDKMFKQDVNEARNPYGGGVDLFYSASSEDMHNGAFEISYQGLTSDGCKILLRTDWGRGEETTLIAIGGFPTAQPSGVLNDIYYGMKQSDIKNSHIFVGNEGHLVSTDKTDKACACSSDTCSVVWKFH